MIGPVEKILTDALALLREKGWTKGRSARFKNGRECRPTDKRAACFCSLGAISAAAGPRPPGGHIVYAQMQLEGQLAGKSIMGFNDDEERTFPEVEAAFLKAIQSAHAASA